MTLPDRLREGIELLVADAGRKRVEEAASRLSDAYREGGPGAARAARSSLEVAAYLAARAPATYAAAAEVLRRVDLARPDWRPTSLLDLGAGPGIASWAAMQTWPGITDVTLVEAEPEMVRAGKALAARGAGSLARATWKDADAGAEGSAAELVIASYLIGELEPASLAHYVAAAWERTTDTLVIVEPGTTAGYRRVLSARTSVVAAGGSTLAPCPHDAPCPLPEGDWCHFSVRLPRSRTHRLSKAAERGFEDEKFSYAVLCREPHERAAARVLRRPDLRPGHVVLALCTPSGLERRTVSRKEGGVYRLAKKSAWGDTVPGA